jgi:hypothetical protein
MSGPTPEQLNPLEGERQQRAHEWITTLAETVLAFDSKAGNHVEYTIATNQENATELLEVMRLDDLLFKPGDMLGDVQYAKYAGLEAADYKMGLWHRFSFVVPQEPTRIFLTAMSVVKEGEPSPMYHVGLGFEYDRGRSLYRQIVGLVAEQNFKISATCIAYGRTNEQILLEEQRSRSHSTQDAHESIACLKDVAAFVQQKM